MHFRVTNWRYIGSALGRCTHGHLCERLMREELFKGGPMTAAMEPRGNDYSNFQYYKTGILHEIAEMDTRPGELPSRKPPKSEDCSRTNCYTFRKNDHALLLAGWGADETDIGCYFQGGKNDGSHKCDSQTSQTSCEALSSLCRWGGYPYWILLNSWGKSYGENGFLKVGLQCTPCLSLHLLVPLSLSVLRAGVVEIK